MVMDFILAIGLMAVTGFVDGQWFSLIPKIWKPHGVDFLIVGKIVILYNLGLLTYIGASHFLVKQGVENALIMTLIWFVATIISLAVISGSFITLNTVDKIIALAAILLVGLLYYRGISG